METPLEPLETKLARYIEEWKVAHQDDSEKYHVEHDISDYNLSRFIALHPEMIRTNPSQDLSLVDTLLSLPTLIRDAQERFDEVDFKYQQEITVETLMALDTQMFKGKDGEPRAASNEREREIIINYTLTHEIGIIDLTQKRQEAIRELQYLKHRFEVTQLLVERIVWGNGE